MDDSVVGVGVTDFITINCPHCGEEFETPVEPTEGATEFVLDCEICCRPMRLRLRIADGEVEFQEISGE